MFAVEIEERSPLPAGISAADLLAFAQEVLSTQGAPAAAEVAVVFGDDELLRELNVTHRGRDEPTDVLSFPAAEGEAFPAGDGEAEATYLGDIAISVSTAARQAADAGLDVSVELRHLLLHGLLHLLGHDHEGPEEAAAMEALEERYLGVAIHRAGGE